ncbi:MAG: CapA family protein [Clostridia bacterium]|nr:CapA family protein [Clostridia bacterium]
MRTKDRIKAVCLLLALLCLPAGARAEGGAFGAAPTLEPVVPLRSARIRSVGDLMVHKKQLEIARQPDGSYDFHPQYALIADSLADADYTIANLETTIGQYENRPYSGFPMFNTPESLLDAVRDAGVDFLTLANNHMLDRYFEGMVKTVDNVEAWGFDFGGANRSPEEQAAPKVVAVNGINIGFLCYTQMTNGMEDWSNAAVKTYGVNYLRKANISEEVQRLREAGADVVIAIPHWGEEYFRRPESYVVAWGRKMIAAGVDVVLGSHPHMVQPVEFVEAQTDGGETRRGLVAWSMGNFISNMTKRYTDSGIILEFTIQERQDGGFGIEGVGCVPIYCWKRDDGIQAISSLKYLDDPPEGMSSGAYGRMQDSYWELRNLLDESIAMLAE